MPAQFSTVRSLIYWEYAKLIAGQVTGERQSYAFVNFTYQRLQQQRIKPSAILTENQMVFQAGEVCVYCGADENLEWEHIIRRTLNGPDTFDNMVRACRSCNASKGARDPYRWYTDRRQIDQIPRLVLGKLLKVTFAEFERRDVLDDTAFMRQHDIKRSSLADVFMLPI